MCRSLPFVSMHLASVSSHPDPMGSGRSVNATKALSGSSTLHATHFPALAAQDQVFRRPLFAWRGAAHPVVREVAPITASRRCSARSIPRTSPPRRACMSERRAAESIKGVQCVSDGAREVMEPKSDRCCAVEDGRCSTACSIPSMNVAPLPLQKGLAAVDPHLCAGDVLGGV